MSESQIARRVKAAGLAGWESFSVHSGRMGMAQNGTTTHAIARRGHWKQGGGMVGRYTTGPNSRIEPGDLSRRAGEPFLRPSKIHRAIVSGSLSIKSCRFTIDTAWSRCTNRNRTSFTVFPVACSTA